MQGKVFPKPMSAKWVIHMEETTCSRRGPPRKYRPHFMKADILI